MRLIQRNLRGDFKWLSDEDQKASREWVKKSHTTTRLVASLILLLVTLGYEFVPHFLHVISYPINI